MYTHIVFDADGTLLDSENVSLLSLRDVVLELFGKDIALDDLRFSFGLVSAEVWKRLGVASVEQANILWTKYYFKHSGSITLFEGIREVLDELAGLPRVLGLVTSKDESEYANDIVRLGISDYFDFTILAECTEKHKPHPDPMLKFLEYSKAVPEETLYVGDTEYDFQCAKGAGVDFALAVWGAGQRCKVEADHYLDHPSDILRLV